MCLMAESRVLSERQAGRVLGSRHDCTEDHKHHNNYSLLTRNTRHFSRRVSVYTDKACIVCIQLCSVGLRIMWNEIGHFKFGSVANVCRLNVGLMYVL